MIKLKSKIAGFKKNDLVQLARDIGVSPTGKKTVLQDNILPQLQAFSNLKLPTRLVAIDVGYVNLGYVHLELCQKSPKSEIRVLDWKLICPDMPKEYNVQKYATQCRLTLDQGLFKSDTGIYLIERQSWRSIGIRGSIPQSILRTTAFESLLMGMLMERSQNAVVESILPGLVSKHFGFDPKSTTNRYKSKKEFSIAKVEEFLGSGVIKCPKKLRNCFEEAKKRDDLSDSLLLGVAYCDWIRKAKSFVDH